MPHPSRSPSSTFDLLRWPEAQPPPPPLTPLRPQPVDGVGSILLGATLTPQEEEALQKKKQNSESKRREMTGSGIFLQDADHESGTIGTYAKPTVRVHQPAGGVSQISFSEEGSISPKKPTSLPEVAKQRELSGTLDSSTEDTSNRKPTSTAKVKELVGSNIFAPPPDLQPRSLVQSLDDNAEESTPPAKFAGSHLASFGELDNEISVKKLNVHKVAELSGSNIFKEDTAPAMPEKSLSAAKKKEITGSDIFADEKPIMRDLVGGIRKPPGGESSLALV